MRAPHPQALSCLAWYYPFSPPFLLISPSLLSLSSLLLSSFPFLPSSTSSSSPSSSLLLVLFFSSSRPFSLILFSHLLCPSPLVFCSYSSKIILSHPFYPPLSLLVLCTERCLGYRLQYASQCPLEQSLSLHAMLLPILWLSQFIIILIHALEITLLKS